MRVLRRLAVHVVVREPRRPPVTARARVDLAIRRARRAAPRRAGLRHRQPLHAAALVERDREPLRRGERLPVALLARPADMGTARAMACLARHVQLRPRRGELLRGRVEALAQVRRMALGAHEVPVLPAAGPVQPVAGLDVLAGVEMEPALPALRLRPAVPGDRQRLHAAAGQLDQVLLQRPHAERVPDLEVGELAVGTIGRDDELAVAPRERRRGAGVGELRAGEVAQHRRVVGDLHREVVVGTAPCVDLLAVALGAHGAADVLRRLAPTALVAGAVAGGVVEGGPGVTDRCSTTSATTPATASAAAAIATPRPSRLVAGCGEGEAGAAGGAAGARAAGALRFLLTP